MQPGYIPIFVKKYFMKQLLTIVFAAIFCITSAAQRSPLKGSGKVVSKVFDFTGFDKISLQDLDGNIEIEAGKAFSISIDIDDNLESLLQVSNSDGKLSVSLAGNRNNRKYIEDTHIKIKITLPQLTALEHDGNTGLTVNGLTGKYFRLSNGGNGTAQLNGSIEELEIKNTGNGNVKAKELLAQQVMVNCRGNGNVVVNAAISITANAQGNSSVINTGKADFSAASSASGNAGLMQKQ
jgi:Putative auto-transporter adhesin, head GIN domain